MAFQDSLQRKPQSTQCAVLQDSFHGIVRAGGSKAAAIRKRRGHEALIHTNRKDKNLAKHASILASKVPLDNWQAIC